MYYVVSQTVSKSALISVTTVLGSTSIMYAYCTTIKLWRNSCIVDNDTIIVYYWYATIPPQFLGGHANFRGKEQFYGACAYVRMQWSAYTLRMTESKSAKLKHCFTG